MLNAGRIVAVLGSVCLTAALAAVPAQARSHSVSCSSGRTFVATASVRVFGVDASPHDTVPFAAGYRAYACLKSHKERKLGFYESGEGIAFGPYHFAVGGRFVAFDQAQCDRQDCSESQITLIDLRNGKKRVGKPAPKNARKISDLLVNPSGAAAWIRPIFGAGARVEKLEGSATTILDSGPGVARGSLAIAGSSLYWTSDGTAKVAQLK